MPRKPQKKPSPGHSLLEPSYSTKTFDSFTSLAQGYDALIAEFYEYYRERAEEEPNLFGFVTVRHLVRFTPRTDSIYTENMVGQKTTVIYAPVLPGESDEEQEERRLKLLVAFDHTKRASHILAIALLLGFLKASGLRRLVVKTAMRRSVTPKEED